MNAQIELVVQGLTVLLMRKSGHLATRFFCCAERFLLHVFLDIDHVSLHTHTNFVVHGFIDLQAWE